PVTMMCPRNRMGSLSVLGPGGASGLSPLPAAPAGRCAVEGVRVRAGPATRPILDVCPRRTSRRPHPQQRPGRSPRVPPRTSACAPSSSTSPPTPRAAPPPTAPSTASAAAPRTEPQRPPETLRLRPVLEALPAYVPGRPPADDGVRRFKVSSNESHFPPIAAVRDAAVASLDGANRYPDAAARQLRERLGAKHGVDPSQIALSTGSVAVTGDLVRALVGEGDEVVFAWRSFEAYPILVGSHGGV